jgi:3-(3-hydroxy-phenyl)propionate hydroxylase
MDPHREQSNATYDAAIVGFGPAGATLAGLLARAGNRVLVIERDTDVFPLPRAVHYDHEVMRTFQTLGVSEEVLAHSVVAQDCEFWNAEREVLIHAKMGIETDQGWYSDYMFHQPSVDQVLRDAATAQPTADVRLATELTDLRWDEAGVELDLRSADGETSQAHARYLVGCDGANSLVRRIAGIEIEDLAFDEPWVVVDIKGAKGLPEGPIQLCDPARPTTLVPGAHDMYRFEFMLLPGEGEEMAQHENLRGLIAQWLDPDSIEIVRAAVYRFHALLARDWLRGPVLLAGDAAHQTPPFLGQGMCAGIRDAMNLSWKLDAVLRGRAQPKLLESYGSERAPHVRSYVERAVLVGKLICTQDPQQARERDAKLLGLRASGNPAPMPTDLPPLGEGLFQTGVGGSAERHPLVAHLAPQPRVPTPAGEKLLDEATGPGFQLLLRRAPGSLDDATGEALDQLGATVVEWSTPEGEAFFERHGLHGLLARPDHVVFGVARNPDEIGTLVRDAASAVEG